MDTRAKGPVARHNHVCELAGHIYSTEYSSSRLVSNPSRNTRRRHILFSRPLSPPERKREGERAHTWGGWVDQAAIYVLFSAVRCCDERLGEGQRRSQRLDQLFGQQRRRRRPSSSFRLFAPAACPVFLPLTVLVHLRILKTLTLQLGHAKMRIHRFEVGVMI